MSVRSPIGLGCGGTGKISDAWTTDAQFDASRKDEANPFKLVIGGIDYRIIRRAAFGEGDQQHVIFGICKDSLGTGCVIAHSEYTVCAGIYDVGSNQMDDPLCLQMQKLMTAYKGSGF